MPINLIGADYVKTSNSDKTSNPLLVEVTVDVVADLYLFLDNRISSDVATAMPWVGVLGFTDTGADLDIDEAGDGDVDQSFSIYLKSNVAAGSTTFLEQDNGGSRNFYGIAAVAAVPEPATAALGLLGIGGLLMRRKRHAA